MRTPGARRRVVATTLVAAVAAALSVPALAQTSAEVRLRDAQLSPDGSSRLVVGLEGLDGAALDGDAFQVFEDGQEIADLDVEALTETDDVSLVIAMPFDISGSVEPVFGDIQAAARGFVEDVTAAGVEVALIPFSSQVKVAVPPTSDTATLVAAIDALEPSGRTLLYDAIVTSGEVLDEHLAGRDDGIAIIVVFSDGADNGSTAEIGDAIAAAQRLDAPITTVGWEADDFDPESMGRMADETGGTVVSSEDASEVAGLFEGVAADITNQYVIRYSSDILEPAELPVSVIVDSPAGELRVDSLAINSRTEAALAPAPPAPTILAEPRFAFLGTAAGLWLGVTAAFLAALALLWIMLVSSRRTAGARSLDRGLQVFGRGDRRPSSDEVLLPTSRFTERAIDLVGRVPKPTGFEPRLQTQLDRAAWPMRANEFLVLSVASGLLGGLTIGGTTGNLLWAVVGAVIAGFVPTLVMRIKIGRRRVAFEEQLPATLQLLAGSLRAGYGLLQALDAVVKEADDPTSSEFARVLTEARLGMPLDEALEGMAQRLDSDDFHWVVLAIGIQREVGGNLAELLTTVAETMRSRATLRRQIKVLSAEGRISAWIVGLMPFFVAFALSIINPGYLAELFQRIEGLVMLGFGAALLVLGMLWLRKIVDIEV